MSSASRSRRAGERMAGLHARASFRHLRSCLKRMRRRHCRIRRIAPCGARDRGTSGWEFWGCGSGDPRTWSGHSTVRAWVRVHAEARRRGAYVRDPPAPPPRLRVNRPAPTHERMREGGTAPRCRPPNSFKPRQSEPSAPAIDPPHPRDPRHRRSPLGIDASPAERNPAERGAMHRIRPPSDASAPGMSVDASQAMSVDARTRRDGARRTDVAGGGARVGATRAAG